MHNHFYYILRCVDGSYYIGHTDNIEQRLSQHHLGLINCYTKKRRPLELVYLNTFASRDDVFHAERQLKGWSRKKKEAFIREDWDEIRILNNMQKMS